MDLEYDLWCKTKKIVLYLCRSSKISDMQEEVANDCQETAVTVCNLSHPTMYNNTSHILGYPSHSGIGVPIQAIEKSSNYEAASKMLQEDLCKKYGGGWHVVMGEGKSTFS